MPPQTSATTMQGGPATVRAADLETAAAAEEAARRSGMPLAEWLSGIMTAHPEEGLRSRARELRQDLERREAQERLERLAQAGRETVLRERAVQTELAPLLEKLVHETRNRNEALEHKTATALGALVGFIERAEQHRRDEVGSIASAQERTSTALKDALALLTSRLDDIEQQADAEREGELQSLRESVVRLEARVDDLGSREDAGQLTQAVQDTLRDLEKRLVDVAEKLDPAARGEAPVAMADADRLARIDAALGMLVERLGPGLPGATAESPDPLLLGLRDDVQSIAARLDFSHVERELVSLRSAVESAAARGPDLSGVEERLGEILSRLARDEAADRASAGSDHAGQGFAALSARVDRLLETLEDGAAPAPDLSPLHDEFAALRRDLAETAAQPGTGALDAIQAQIAALASSLERKDEGVSAIRALEQSVGDLSARIEEARHSTVAAARETVQQAAAAAAQQALASLPRAGEDADALTRETLCEVRDTLDKIVDRLATLESDLVGDRVRMFALVQNAVPSGPRGETAEGAERRAGATGEPQARAAVSTPPRDAPAPARTSSPPVTEKLAAAVAAAEAARALGPSGPAVRMPAATPAPAPVSGPVPTPSPAEGPGARESRTPAPAGADALDRPLEPGTGRPAPQQPDPLDQVGSVVSTDVSKSAFIAAARLAAQTSARSRTGRPADLAPHGLAQDSGFGKGASSRGARLRSLIDENRRPILIGLAAVALVLAAIQIGRQFLLTAEAPLATAPAEAPSGAVPAGPGAQAPTGEAPSPRPEAAPPAATPSPPGQPAPDPSAQGKSSDLLAPVPGSPAGGFTQRSPGPQDPDSVGAITPAKPLEGIARAPLGDLAAAPLPRPLQKAVADGSPAAAYEVASRFFEGRSVSRDTHLAAAWFERAAQAGFAPAQYRIGSMYEKGVGVPADVAKARMWYQRGAQAGNVKAMHNLGVVLADGSGGKPDYAAAANWFRMAAERGLKDSQYNLAILSARGLGVDQNLVQSWAWFALAAAQGDEDAGRKRDEVGARLDAAGLASAKALAEKFKPIHPDDAANEVASPPGGWEQTGDARRENKRAARL